MKLYTVDFKPVWPVGGHLFIYADSIEEAMTIASETVTHTEIQDIEEVSEKKGVVSYDSGEY